MPVGVGFDHGEDLRTDRPFARFRYVGAQRGEIDLRDEWTRHGKRNDGDN
jgi:hypothetical protein